jgi:hypothetical protein
MHLRVPKREPSPLEPQTTESNATLTTEDHRAHKKNATEPTTTNATRSAKPSKIEARPTVRSTYSHERRGKPAQHQRDALR